MITQQVYDASTHLHSQPPEWSAKSRPLANHVAHPDYPGVNAHDAEVLRVRHVHPDVAAARGVRTQGRHMVIPWHTAQGTAGPEQTRPHAPGTGPKYLFKRGAEMVADVHPYSQPFLAYLDVPIIITESALKADAIISALIAAGISRFCVLAINGVQGWSRGGKLLPCFDAIPLRGRIVYIIFDSDTLTNPKVAKARRRFTTLLRSEHGAEVRWIDLPTTPEGEKQGIDDALASGLHSLDDLLASASPAPEEAPEDHPAQSRRDEYWKARALKAEADKRKIERDMRELIALQDTPHLTDTQKTFLRRTACEAMAKASHGTHHPDGYVQLSPRYISGDHRGEADRKKENAEGKKKGRPKLNPDGSRYHMERSAVMSTAKELQALGLFAFKETSVPYTRKNGRRCQMPELLVAPPESLADFLTKAARYVPPVIVERADYGSQAPCSQCGEVHAQTVITSRKSYCGTVDDPGCGAQTKEKETIVTLPVPPANDPNITEEQREQLDRITGGGGKGDPLVSPPESVPDIEPESMSRFFLDIAPSSPLYLSRKNLDIEFDGHNAESDLCACGAPLPPGRRWSCSEGCDGTPKTTGRVSA